MVIVVSSGNKEDLYKTHIMSKEGREQDLPVDGTNTSKLVWSGLFPPDRRIPSCSVAGAGLFVDSCKEPME